MSELTDLVTGKNIALAAVISIFIGSLKWLFPTLAPSKFGQRYLPLFPVVVGVALALMGFGDPALAPRWQDQVLLGALAGFASGHLFNMGKKSLFGMGVEEPAAPAPALPQPPEPPAPPPAGEGK